MRKRANLQPRKSKKGRQESITYGVPTACTHQQHIAQLPTQVGPGSSGQQLRPQQWTTSTPTHPTQHSSARHRDTQQHAHTPTHPQGNSNAPNPTEQTQHVTRPVPQSESQYSVTLQLPRKDRRPSKARLRPACCQGSAWVQHGCQTLRQPVAECTSKA